MKIRNLFLALTAIASVAVTAQVPAPLKAFTEKINKAEGLEATFTIQSVTGAASNYKVAFAKPNKARIDGPLTLVVADGETISTYFKATKKWFKKDQNAREFGRLLNNDEMRLFTPFFKKDALDKYTAKQLADTKRRAKDMKSVAITLDGANSKIHTVYMDSAEGMLQQGVLEWKTKNGKETRIFDFAEIALGAGKDAFAFKAPAGSTEVSEADLLAVKWLENLDDAIAEAKATNKMVLVDSFATWCGPCHRMEDQVFPTERFRNIASDFVFCRIDVDQQASVAQMLKIEAMPTTIILNSAGDEVGRWVGYGDVEGYFEELNKASNGKY